MRPGALEGPPWSMAVSKVVKEPETLRGERDSMNKSNLDVEQTNLMINWLGLYYNSGYNTNNSGYIW